MKILITGWLFIIPFLGFAQEVYEEVDEMPKYAGCEDATFPECTLPSVSDFIAAKLNYPYEAQKNKIEGTALIKFIVESDGTITDVDLVRDPGKGCGTEALRIVQQMASEVKWIAGKKDGKAVAVRFTLPIQFKLS